MNDKDYKFYCIDDWRIRVGGGIVLIIYTIILIKSGIV